MAGNGGGCLGGGGGGGGSLLLVVIMCSTISAGLFPDYDLGLGHLSL